MNKDLLESVIRMTGDLLSDPDRRCTNVSAEDKNGMPVSPTDENACKWCLTGALYKSLQTLKVNEPKDELQAYNYLKESLGIGLEIAAPVFWDSNEDLHDVIAKRLQKIGT